VAVLHKRSIDWRPNDGGRAEPGGRSNDRRRRRNEEDPVKNVIWASLASALFLSIACTATEDPPVEPQGGSSATDVTILDDCPELPCEGPLEPGRYRWTFSEPTIDFEIPSSGWTWRYGGGGLELIADTTQPPPHTGLYVPDGMYLVHDPTIASRDCEEVSEPGVGTSVSDLVAWLENAPGLVVSEPTQVTVGGFEGMQIDIQIDPAWKRTCVFSEDLPAVPLLFNGSAPLGGYHWSIVPEQSLRWYILDSEDEVIIVNLEDDPGGLPHNELMQAGGQIVDSLVFS
jgi:hypothetical protein